MSVILRFVGLILIVGPAFLAYLMIAISGADGAIDRQDILAVLLGGAGFFGPAVLLGVGFLLAPLSCTRIVAGGVIIAIWASVAVSAAYLGIWSLDHPDITSVPAVLGYLGLCLVVAFAAMRKFRQFRKRALTD